MSGAWAEWVDDQCRLVRVAGRWREPRTFDAAGPVGRIGTGDEPVVSFASNDYLGLTQHPDVRRAARHAIDRWGTGSGASRLVVGSRPVHDELEAALAAWKGTEAALVFATGYAANTGVLATLGGPGVRICSDALNHASIVDGCRLARANGADVQVFAHADLDQLASLLGAPGAERQLVVTDTVFSMDGDRAAVDELRALCADHGALLVLDDAHDVFGDSTGRPHDGGDVLRIGTLSKTLAALGGFVAGDRRVIELLVNRARPFIFSTAPTPADTAAALAALAVVRGPQGDALRARLREHIDALRPGHVSPIVPLIVGDDAAAVSRSAALLERGILVPAIRPPTVPDGTARLRVALSAAHTAAQVEHLRTSLAEVGCR